MSTTTTVVRANEIEVTLLNHIQPIYDPWNNFEAELLRKFQHGFAAAGVTAVHVNVRQTNSPGPLIIEVSVTTTHMDIQGSVIKQFLRTTPY